MSLDIPTQISLASLGLSIVAVGLSILTFYMSRRDKKAKIRILTTCINADTSILHTQILNTGETTVHIAKVVLTVEPIKRTWKPFPKRRIRFDQPEVPMEFEPPYLERAISYNQPAVLLTGKRKKKITYQIVLTKEPFKIEAKQPIELVHRDFEDNLLELAREVKLRPKEIPIVHGYIIAYDGTLKTYKSNPFPIWVQAKPSQPPAKQFRSKTYPTTNSKTR